MGNTLNNIEGTRPLATGYNKIPKRAARRDLRRSQRDRVERRSPLKCSFCQKEVTLCPFEICKQSKKLQLERRAPKRRRSPDRSVSEPPAKRRKTPKQLENNKTRKLKPAYP